MPVQERTWKINRERGREEKREEVREKDGERKIT